MASIPKGSRPGQLFYAPVLPSPIRPGCFALDDKEYIYVPEVHDGIRIEKLDPKGEFIVTLALEGPRNWVRRIVVAATGAMYLVTHAPNSGGEVVNKYSAEGELLFQLGPKGILKGEELSQGYFRNPNAYHEEYFRSVTEILVNAQGHLVVWEGNKTPQKCYTFHPKGLLLGTSEALPSEIADRLEKHRARHDALNKWLWSPSSMREGDKMGISDFPGPDGHYYYMGYKLAGRYMGHKNQGKEVLGFEIRRVIFPEGSGSGPGAGPVEE